MTKISIFLPVRSGSKRVLKKNTRPFHPNGMSLFEYKLAQIEKIKNDVDEVVISTNDQEIIDQIPDRLKDTNIRLVVRPDHLCTSDTKVQDLITHAAEATKGDAIFWMHVTSPFVDENDYRAAIKQYKAIIESGEGDSLLSVNKMQQFIWSDKEGKIINVDREVNPWPNTQDLDPLYEINHAFYINSRKNYDTLKDRIGKSPAFYICEGLKKIDIDWHDDFVVAQHLISFYEASR